MSTTVTGILRDSSGQLWTNAPVQLIFQVTPGAAGPFVWSGGAFNGKPPIVISDPLTAAFTITVPANNEIVPANSYWQIIIGPGATFPAFVLNVHLVTGSLDISTLFGTQASLGFTQSMAVPRAYADSEVIVPPNSGQLYYDVTNKALKFFENGIWNALATGGGAPVMVYPAAGIGVSTGTAWTTSIDPADVPRLSTANTFTANQTVNATITGIIINASTRIASGGDVLVGGPSPNIPNVARLSTNSGTFYCDCFGTSPSAVGSMNVRLISSDGSLAVFPLAITSTGVSVTGTLSASGNIAASGSVASSTTMWATQHLSAGASVFPLTGSELSAYRTAISNSGIWSVITCAGDGGSRGQLQIGGIGPGGGLGWQEYADFTPSGLHVIGTINCDNGGNITGPTVFTVGNAGIHTTGGCIADGGFYTSSNKAFLIPHPLDETKELVHACLEGPESGVYYRGRSVTDINKRVQVFLPHYFEALTFPESISVLLTQIVDGEQQLAILAVVEIIGGGSFTVRSSIPNVTFFWEVKAVRKIGVDRLEVEPLKKQN